MITRKTIFTLASAFCLVVFLCVLLEIDLSTVFLVPDNAHYNIHSNLNTNNNNTTPLHHNEVTAPASILTTINEVQPPRATPIQNTKTPTDNNLSGNTKDKQTPTNPQKQQYTNDNNDNENENQSPQNPHSSKIPVSISDRKQDDPTFFHEIDFSRPDIDGDFDYFIENEYELMLNNSLSVDSYWKAIVSGYDLFVPLSKLPQVFIIGVMKAGTTTLHDVLTQHPSIMPPINGNSFYSKETHFFDRPDHYMSLKKYPLFWDNPREKNVQVFKEEATPGYFYFPLSPFRIRHTYKRSLAHNKYKQQNTQQNTQQQTPTPTPPQQQQPDTDTQKSVHPKIPLFFVVVLRDPISRAYSHCQHYFKQTCTPEFFDEWTDLGISKTNQFWNDFDFSKSTDPLAHFMLESRKPRKYPDFRKESYYFHRGYHEHHIYWEPDIFIRGFYAAQIERWWRVFPKENLFILQTSDLREDKIVQTANQIFEWMGLPSFKVKYEISNSRSYPEMLPSTRKKLENFYRKPNEDLMKLLNRKFDWN